jgi:hypothetical protein
MGLPMFRPFCKSINKKECNVEVSGVSTYILSRLLVQAM